MHHRGAAASDLPWVFTRGVHAIANDFRRLLHWHGLCVRNSTMPIFIRMCCALCASLCLSACAPLLAMVVGYSQPLVQFVAQAERVKLVGDGVSYVGSGKTITDHALSKIAGADCRVFNVVSRDPVCAPIKAGE